MKTLNILTAAALILIASSGFANPDTTATDSVKISESASVSSIDLPAFEWGYGEEAITELAAEGEYSYETTPVSEAVFRIELPEFIWGDPDAELNELGLASVHEQVITFELPEFVWGDPGFEPSNDSAASAKIDLN